MLNPQPLPDPPAVPDPEDVPFRGRVIVEVDATDVERRIVSSRIMITTSPGPMTLLFAKWLPGYHAPAAPIELLSGLEIRAGDEPIQWIRHPTTVNAFHIDIPHGCDEIEARFQFLSPTDENQGRVTVTPDLLMLQWNTVLIYPAGHFARQIEVEARLKLPDGWSFASALAVDRMDGGQVQFARVRLDMLVDSPVMAGRHFRSISLDDRNEVTLNIAADHEGLLAIDDGPIELHRNLVKEVDLLFGARHFARYEMLLAVSEVISAAGVEHHQSCEAVSLPGYFTNWDGVFPRHDTIPHEYLHSWNGKHRRGADSWQPCFEKPIRSSLMWVYEGLTQYYCRVLCVRSGMWTADQAREALAISAAVQKMRPGSRWRPLIDTTRDPIIAARDPLPWMSWQRSEDYYSEGALMWLDVDTLIRELSGDERSLDDFAFDFFGPQHAGAETQVYRFDDVVDCLHGVAANDWKGYFEEQLTETREGAPLGGIARGGYELVYREVPTSFAAAMAKLEGVHDFSFSVGLKVKDDGEIVEVIWDSPAFEQSLIAGGLLRAVNGRTFSVELLRAAIAGSAEGKAVQLVSAAAGRIRDVRLNYNGGSRYPHLQRIDGMRARLDEVLAPRTLSR